MYNDNDRENYEYHYSYRPESGSFQPSQTPARVKPKKKGRAGKIIAVVLCGALLIGGSFGAGWFLNRQPAPSEPAAPVEDVNDEAEPSDDGRLYISDRPGTEIGTVAVTGGEKLTFAQVYQANVDSCVSINTQAMATVAVPAHTGRQVVMSDKKDPGKFTIRFNIADCWPRA